jgi:serine/threonine protein kinase
LFSTFFHIWWLTDFIFIEFVKREAELLKQLDHPNIVKIYEFRETKKHLYFILE